MKLTFWHHKWLKW